MTEDRKEQVSRRQALKRIAAAGAVAWAVPTVQTINMSRAFAQTQTSPPTTCSWFRVGSTGICGPIVGNSCLSSEGSVVDCSPLIGIASTPSAAEWVVSLAPGYEVAEVALSAGGICWSSAQNPSSRSSGLSARGGYGQGAWGGWFTNQYGGLHLQAPVDTKGAPIPIDHIDVIACQPSPIPPRPEETPSSSETPTPSETPTGSETPTTSETPTPSETPTTSETLPTSPSESSEPPA